MNKLSEFFMTRPKIAAIFVWAAALAGLVIWGALYAQLDPLASWLVSWLPLDPGTRLYEAARFFLFDTPKICLLLILVVFAMGVVRSYFSPARARALLGGRREGLGNVLAAGLGILTPFCSCSAVPLFIGFVTAGVPLGVTLSFLIAAPMINEVALGLLWGLLGWQVAAAYLVFGLVVSIAAGWIIGRLRLESWLEDWVRNARAEGAEMPPVRLAMKDRMEIGIETVRGILGKVWPWILAGVAVGAFIHGYAPAEKLAPIMGKEAWWAVPAAVGLGVPMYANHAGIIPVVEALLGKGAALGTVLAFMMAVTALSLPEAIMLRKVLKPRLLAVYFAIVALGILAVGYIFNALFG